MTVLSVLCGVLLLTAAAAQGQGQAGGPGGQGQGQGQAGGPGGQGQGQGQGQAGGPSGQGQAGGPSGHGQGQAPAGGQGGPGQAGGPGGQGQVGGAGGPGQAGGPGGPGQVGGGAGWAGGPQAFDWLGQNNKVALTFEGGPYIEGELQPTCQVLDNLKSCGVPATFFFNPDILLNGANQPLLKQTVKRVCDEGHYIGLHGWKGWADNFNQQDFHAKVDQCNSWISDACGKPCQIKHFRPCDGDKVTYPMAQQIELVIALWNVDGQDEQCSGDYQKIWSNIDSCKSYPSKVIRLHEKHVCNAVDSSTGKSVIDQIVECYGPKQQFVTTEKGFDGCDHKATGICKCQHWSHKTLCGWPHDSKAPGYGNCPH